ncbi:MAG: CoA-binding protein, partial [Candidatus Binatia bacterium]|nr:CoA-binding protein [Candidatus Binatia bacterium]
MMSRLQSDLDVLFNPKSVAIIGASNRPESISGQFLHYLTRHKFAGSIYPVNPRHKEISGFRCYGSITE